jgi:hypothetical protein
MVSTTLPVKLWAVGLAAGAVVDEAAGALAAGAAAGASAEGESFLAQPNTAAPAQTMARARMAVLFIVGFLSDR